MDVHFLCHQSGKMSDARMVFFMVYNRDVKLNLILGPDEPKFTPWGADSTQQQQFDTYANFCH